MAAVKHSGGAGTLARWHLFQLRPSSDRGMRTKYSVTRTIFRSRHQDVDSGVLAATASLRSRDLVPVCAENGSRAAKTSQPQGWELPSAYYAVLLTPNRAS
jgi:hypothetical protein